MFTGIIEQLGKVKEMTPEGGNLHITIEASLTPELKIDQSVAHNGVCLTVVSINENEYTVTAIQETLEKTNLCDLQIGDIVNLERCMKLGARLDGHIVQGHVDTTAKCTHIETEDGSWVFHFSYERKSPSEVTVEKGSICVNGTSLTVVNSKENAFSVCIIPYTYENTCFKDLKKGDRVNLEFDIIGKYIARLIPQ
ncbi:MAG: riboflavin synthase [Flavobacteriales bacterium]|nr:riboflavin synthase [Flavobacteriales bacterium]